MLEKVADSARKAVKLAEPYKPYGGQFLEFCSISLSTYQTCIKLPENVLNSANFSAGIIRQGLESILNTAFAVSKSKKVIIPNSNGTTVHARLGWRDNDNN